MILTSFFSRLACILPCLLQIPGSIVDAGPVRSSQTKADVSATSGASQILSDLEIKLGWHNLQANIHVDKVRFDAGAAIPAEEWRTLKVAIQKKALDITPSQKSFSLYLNLYPRQSGGSDQELNGVRFNFSAYDATLSPEVLVKFCRVFDRLLDPRSPYPFGPMSGLLVDSSQYSWDLWGDVSFPFSFDLSYVEIPYPTSPASHQSSSDMFQSS
ncbi:MAG: hypothetical protein M1825_002316 [Sarcosagium campestre]|nr:MAG: hypothetical protein M1825_002316 [Sarcosagium campestre]